jgi:hypothetical protein
LPAAASDCSRAWQPVHSVFGSGRPKSCGLWQDAHVVPGAWADVSDEAMAPWQLVQRETRMLG